MRTYFNFLVLGLLTIAFASSSLWAQSPLGLGAGIPLIDNEMEEVTGRNSSLRSSAKENGLIVIFSSNTCPWVLRYESRYLELSSIARENNIGMIAINPNEAYRDRGDGMEDMIKHAEKAEYNFPYVLDKNHEVADAFGAKKTPHIYLFNGEKELVYFGAIDDNANDANAVEEYYLRDAIEAMIAGREIPKAVTSPLGCTIKSVS